MYNLAVANDHTYFVGVGGVLGHNADYCSKILVNEKIVRKALAGSPYRTHQKNVSLPKIARMVVDMLKGDKFPAIYVDGNRIIQGHHRYIASKISGVPIDVLPGTLPGFRKNEKTHSILDIVLSELDY